MLIKFKKKTLDIIILQIYKFTEATVEDEKGDVYSEFNKLLTNTRNLGIKIMYFWGLPDTNNNVYNVYFDGNICMLWGEKLS